MLPYLIKFSISLAVLYIFYRAVLRPLTFYQWNRFYLLGYAMLSFLIPFVDISSWMSEAGAEGNLYINIIPSVSRYTFVAQQQPSSFFQQLSFASWVLLVFLAGALVMLLRVLLQYRSLRSLRAKSRLLTGNGRVQLYETGEAITPFSFGNAIYINPDRHTEEELQRIIQHEFVHVQQKHSVDLLMGELLCIINWFNPFAWCIRHAIRQNLEFIADRQVLQNGIAKKEYQYLLLKVIGAPQYALASHFNFSNLKKRIAMMNKMKSAELHLTKFLFVLPLLAVLLLSFRSHNTGEVQTELPAGNSIVSQQPLNDELAPSPLHLWGTLTDGKTIDVADTLPAPPPPPPPPPPAVMNKKGYMLSVADNNGECVVLVKDQQRKIIKAVTLEEWNRNKKENETRYGSIPPPPPPPPPARPVDPLAPVAPDHAGAIVQVRPVAPLGATVTLNNVNAGNPPLYIVDGKDMPPGYDLNTLNPNDIQSISVWKDEKATGKYGEKAKYGVIDIVTKNKGDLPDGLLIVLDGKQLPAGSKIEDHVKPEAIESMNVLKGKTAAAKYGEKGNAGVIEVTTKNNRDYFPGDVLVLIDGKEIPAGSKIADYVNQQNIESMNVLKDKTAFIKYGEKAKKGAIEIKTKRPVVN